MRVLIQTLGSAGDTYPFIGIGEQLEERGHEVVLFANEVFADTVRSAGLRFVEMGDAVAYRRLAEHPGVWDRRRGIEVIFRAVVDHLEESIEIMEGELAGASILVNGSLGFGARIIRETSLIPLVTAHLAPSLFRSHHRMPRTEVMWVGDDSPWWLKRLWWRAGDFLVDRVVAPKLNAVRAGYGLEPVRRVLADWAVYSPDCTLGLFPEWFGPPQRDWSQPVTLTGFPLYDHPDVAGLDPHIVRWLDDGDPPLVFTAGSGNRQAASFFRVAVDVSRQVDSRAVLVTANDDDVPEWADDGVRHVPFVPFSQLLPRARALVSHGGVGTCAQALAAGAPQIIAHINFDQRDNGSRITDLGCGLHLPMREFLGGAAVDAIGEVLAPRFRERAEELSAEMDGDRAINRACDAIEATAR